MADPLSVLGATAAALQIASQALELVKYLSGLYSKIRDATELKKMRISHLEQLIEISKLVAKTPPLQTAEVQKALVSCLRTIMKLRNLLEKYSLEDQGKMKKVINALKMGNKEDEIITLLAMIEREKSLIALSIHQIDATQLQTININVTQLQSSVNNTSLIITDTAHQVRTMVELLPNIGEQVRGVYQDFPKLTAGIEAIQEQLRVTSISRTTTVESQNNQLYAVPNRRVRDFVGREGVLAQLDETFNSESEVGPRIVVLRALGGQGKTQIALEYCRRTRQKADKAVFWVDASAESTLKQSYSTIYGLVASQVDILSDIDARVNITLQKLKAWHDPWLIVLDNYDNPVEFNNIRDYIPECEQGLVLVTSRHADASGLAKEENRINLPGLPEHEAVDLLFSHDKRQHVDHTAPDCANIIVERLGYHPLAIAQAGAYIHKRKLALDEFLDHFQRRKSIILKETTPQMSQYRRKLEGAERDTSLSVFATWELSYHQLVAEDTDDKCMADLLTLIAFFAEGVVSESLLRTYSGHHESLQTQSSSPREPKGAHEIQEKYAIQQVADRKKHLVPGAFLLLQEEKWDDGLYSDALATMAQLSLVEGFSKASDNTLKVNLHPLVRDWIRLRTEKSGCAKYTYLTATCIHKILLSKKNYRHFNIDFSTGQDMLKQIDTYVINKEDFIPHVSNGLDETSRIQLDEYDLDFAQLYIQFGEYAKAREVYKRCLARRNRETTINDRVTRQLLERLAAVLDQMGEFEAAEEKIRKALQMSQEANGNENGETVDYMDMLGMVLVAQNENELAEGYLRENFKLSVKLFGKENYRTLRCMCSLGNLLGNQGKSREAEELYRKALKMQEVVLGKEHSETLDSMHNLATLLTRPEDFKEREELYRQVWDIEEVLRGKEHPERTRTLKSLAEFLVDMRRYDEAEEMFIEVVRSLEFSFGKFDRITLDSVARYGRLLRKQRRYGEAMAMLARAYTTTLESYGPQNARTTYYWTMVKDLIRCVENEIKNLIATGRKKEADEIFVGFMKSLEAALGASHERTLRLISGHGKVLRNSGKYYEALPFFERAYMGTLESLGSDHADTLRRKQRLDDLLDLTKKSTLDIVTK